MSVALEVIGHSGGYLTAVGVSLMNLIFSRPQSVAVAWASPCSMGPFYASELSMSLTNSVALGFV